MPQSCRGCGSPHANRTARDINLSCRRRHRRPPFPPISAGRRRAQSMGPRNGREALEEIRRKTFDLVITALYMPVQDGSETISALKKEYTGLRIITMVDRFRDFHQGGF